MNTTKFMKTFWAVWAVSLIGALVVVIGGVYLLVRALQHFHII